MRGNILVEMTMGRLQNAQGEVLLVSIRQTVGEVGSQIADMRHLQTIEARYRTLLNLSADLSFVNHVMPDGMSVIVWHSTPTATLLGYMLEELCTRDDWLPLIHPEDRAREESMWQRVVAGTTETIEYRMLTKGETYGWVRVACQPMPDVAGSVAQVYTVVHDITTRKMTEEALRQSEERFRLLVHNSSDMITLTDEEGQHRYVSPSVERILGYTISEWLQLTPFSTIHPEDVARARSHFERSVATPGLHEPISYRMQHKDSSWHYLEMLRNNQLANPDIHGVITNIRDITNLTLWKAEQDNLVIQAALQGQEEERERIALEVHDGICQALSGGFQQLEALQRHAELPESLAPRAIVARDLVQDALKEARGLIARVRPSALDTIGLIPTLEQQLVAKSAQSGMQITFSADRIHVSKGIETTLYRIIHQAVDNAVQHASAAQITVAVRQTQNHIFAVVLDNGCGFDPENNLELTSIGLLSMRKRTELVGGRFTLHSTPGTGTRVQVEIPLATRSLPPSGRLDRMTP